MQHITGVGVSPGRVVGPARVMTERVAVPVAGAASEPGPDAAAEAERIPVAVAAVKADLEERARAASGDAREILEVTAQMAADPALKAAAIKKVTERGAGAERAVWDAADEVSVMLAGLGGYMAERVRDVADVRDRIVAELRGLPAPGIPQSDAPFVLVARDLAPADTATLNPDVVTGLVTIEGGPQSHTAILARSLGIPAVVAVADAGGVADGAEIYLDGGAGEIRTEPGDDERALAASWAEVARRVQAFDGHGQFAGGRELALLANVAGAADARVAAGAGAEGVGLLRTEFCFLDRTEEPSVDDQAAQYRAVFAEFPGKKVVIRTLDAGADKPLPFLTDSSEANPALGVRGIRTSRRSPGVLKRQLEAIAAAAADSDADVWVMAPMIATAGEAAEFARRCRDAGLRAAGVMIEVPSAALTADRLLGAVDFASLGTNDLTQYTMAADRQVGSLADLNDAWQPAVLTLVKAAVDGANAAGKELPGEHPAKPVGVCGEAAADPALAVVLAGLGVSSLSMTARALGPVSALLRTVQPAEAARIAQLALHAESAEDARTIVRRELPQGADLGLY